jgi:DNA-binding XRE family transcriptional regulator
LQSTHAEKEEIKCLHAEFKTHYEQMRQQTHLYQQRLAEEVQARKDTESQMEQRIGDMRKAIELK